MKENKGITLIALIVTIIVLIILAGVAIAMLQGDNGILESATTAKYDTIIGSFDENVGLAALSVRTKITENMVSKSGYIATKNTKVEAEGDTSDPKYFEALVKQVAKDLIGSETVTAGNTLPSTTGYTVYSFIDEGNTSTNGTGYILVTYSDNALRSSLPQELESKSKLTKVGTESAAKYVYRFNAVDYVVANDQIKSTNQAVLAYVIEITNYSCELKGAVITDSTQVKNDTNKTKASEFAATKIGKASL